MSQQCKLGSGHTTIKSEKGKTIITFWNTDIVKFNDKSITLNSGGYKTATTKTRMNQASNQYELNYSVWQEKGKWFVNFRGGILPFRDNMRLNRI